MKKNIVIVLFLSLICQGAMAQPKWVEKAKRAVFSVITYDKEDKMLSSGNGFFVTEDGVDFVQLDDQLVSLPELEKRLSALSPNAPQATIALGIDGKVEMNRVEHIKQVLRKKKIPVIYYLGTEKENPD